MTHSGASERKTIALLLDYMSLSGRGYEAQLRDCFDARCRELGLNLLLIYGRGLEDPAEGSKAHNTVFDMVGPHNADGIIIVSTLLGTHSGAGEVAKLAERWCSMAVCCVGLPVAGLPAVLVDGSLGLSSTIEHLVTEHGKRQLAFIAGPESNTEAVERLEAFRSVLDASGLEYDPRRVVQGNFVEAAGFEAVDRLLEEGVDFDALVCANDNMADGAIEALRAAGLRVPQDVAVTGFDDLEFAALGNPPLTTVAQPFDEIAEAAIDIVLAQVAGRNVPRSQSLAARPVIRRSCGCGFRHHVAASVPPSSEPALDRRVVLETRLAACLRRRGKPDHGTATQLLKALDAQLAGKAGAFLTRLETLIDALSAEPEGTRCLKDALVMLREGYRDATTEPLEDLWHDARDLITLAESARHAKERLDVTETHTRLLAVGERFSLALDRQSIKSALLESLPAVGIRTALVSVFSDSAERRLEPFLFLLKGELRRAENCRQGQLLPCHGPAQGQRSTMVVFPLVFESQHLGVASFEYRTGVFTYAMVRDQLSAALRSAALKEELLTQTLLHERSVQERLATKQRMHALSVLAGGVAHDLNNTLGPLVGLPDLVLMQLRSAGLAPALLDSLSADIESMKDAATRTSETVKDLLTLGRRGRTRKDTIDLGQLVQRFVQSERQVAARVDIRCVATEGTFAVTGAEAQLQRAVSNLLRNAVEATSGGGEVVVSVEHVQLLAPHSGYEVVAPGDYVVVSVHDQGSGINEVDLARVFEPFFSKKKTSDKSGTGLGLAIVHSVVKEHDGFVDVQSGVGQGARFTIYIPRADEQPAQATGSGTQRAVQARILIVDDEPAQLTTGSRLLGHLGYDVDTAESERDALEKFVRASNDRRPYDLVVLDVILGPGSDGLQLFEQMCEFSPTQRGVLVSGHAPRDRMELAAARGLPWLPKPYTLESLARAVRDMLPPAVS